MTYIANIKMSLSLCLDIRMGLIEKTMDGRSKRPRARAIQRCDCAILMGRRCRIRQAAFSYRRQGWRLQSVSSAPSSSSKLRGRSSSSRPLLLLQNVEGVRQIFFAYEPPSAGWRKRRNVDSSSAVTRHWHQIAYGLYGFCLLRAVFQISHWNHLIGFWR